MKKETVRVRFAPSPTGALHLGSLRTALYNYLFARREGGTLVLRIEDTDRARTVPGGTEAILRALVAAGIRHDEGPFLEDGRVVERGDRGPYIQSARTESYREHAERLVASGRAYRCFCTSEELDAMREAMQTKGIAARYDRRCRGLSDAERKARVTEGRASVIRLAVPDTGTVTFTDVVRGDISFSAADIDDAVLLKTDGFPTYHLANVVDDRLMGITHVIRAEEWISSTPKHLLLYAAFRWEPPAFAHLPLLLNADRSKLSKRQGDVAMEQYLAKGYLPEAIVNFVALLGWNPTADREQYSLAELTQLFELRKVNPSGAVVNIEKLQWLNRQYLRELPKEELARRAVPYLVASGALVPVEGREDEWVAPKHGGRFGVQELIRVLELERERVSTLGELPDALDFVFVPPTVAATMVPWRGTSVSDTAHRLEGVRDTLMRCAEPWAEAGIESALKGMIADRGWGNGDVLWPMRVALTGREQSPGPFAVAAALGKEETLDRLVHAIRILTT